MTAPRATGLLAAVAAALFSGCAGGVPDGGTIDGGAPHPFGIDPAALSGVYAAAVADYTVGTGGGFGQDRLPEVVLGPPRGGGEQSGSTDVFSLGIGGSIVVVMGQEIVDGDGPDLVVFENPFRFAGGIFAEPGEVSVSVDGEEWWSFPCEPEAVPPAGCAGSAPVLKNGDDGIDPGSAQAGGDRFDLAALGLARARYVRIVDQGGAAGEGGASGFDLDAVAAITR